MRSYLQVKDLPLAVRAQYLASLPEPQEWFLEELVRSGEVWDMSGEGYAVFDGRTLVEFYATNKNHAHRHLFDLLTQRPFDKVLCKSFDHVLMDAAKELGWTPVETGYLFRRRDRVVLNGLPDLHLVRATDADVSEAWRIGQDFYDSRDEVARLCCSNCLWLGVHDGEMVCNGVAIPIDAAGRVFDVGMVTRSSQRNKGFGRLMVAGLAEMLEGEGKRPICGCGPSNLASKATLEQAGFVSEHRLVQITVP